MKNYSDNIRSHREKKGWTQGQLAKKCGWGQSRISNYERSDREPKSGDIKIIAAALDITVRELLIGENNVVEAPKFKQTVPLISWVQAGSWSLISNDFQADEYYPCPGKHSENTFALTVRGESMSPDFVNGEIIYIDPQVEAKNGSCVVVQQNGDTEATFKQLIIEGDNKYLKALNPHWPERFIEILPDATICGVVIGSYRKR